MEENVKIISQTLPEDQRKLVDLLGPEAYAKLVEVYGGTMIYIYKRDSFIRAARNEEIRRKFDGGNYRRLASEYNLSEAAVRQIVADVAREIRESPIDGQLSIADFL